MPTDYRWLRVSDGLRSGESALGEEDISLGPVTEARRAVHWRPSHRGDRLLAIRSYLTPAKDAAGRTGHLERQVFAVPAEGPLPPAGVLLTLSSALDAASHVEWWPERTRPEWNDPSFTLRFNEAEVAPLAWTGEALERQAAAAVAALKEANSGRIAELAAALRAVLDGQSVVLQGLWEPWSAMALAGLLTLLPEGIGRRLVVQGWSFSPRLSWPSLGRPRLLLCLRGPADGVSGSAVGESTLKGLEMALEGDTDRWWAELEGRAAAPAPAPRLVGAPLVQGSSVEEEMGELLRNPDPRAQPPAALAHRLTEEGIARLMRSRLPVGAGLLITQAAKSGGIGLEGVMDWVESRLHWTSVLPGAPGALADVLVGLGDALPVPREEPNEERIRRLVEAFTGASARARQAFLVAVLDGGSVWRGHQGADSLVVGLTQGADSELLGQFYQWATRTGRPGVTPEQFWKRETAPLVAVASGALKRHGPPQVPFCLIEDGLDRAEARSTRTLPLGALLRAMAVVLAPTPGLVQRLIDGSGRPRVAEETPWGQFLVPLDDRALQALLSLGPADIELLKQIGGRGSDEASQAVLRLSRLSTGGYGRLSLADVNLSDGAEAPGWEPRPSEPAAQAFQRAALAVSFLREMADYIEENVDRLGVNGLYDNLRDKTKDKAATLKEDSDRRPLAALAKGILEGLSQF